MANNFSWKSFFEGFKEGEEYSVSPRWRDDNWRQKIRRLANKGYFKRIPRGDRGYADWFVRTNKAYIEGDSPRKPLTFKQ